MVSHSFNMSRFSGLALLLLLSAYASGKIEEPLKKNKIVVHAFEDPEFDGQGGNEDGLEGWSVLVRDSDMNGLQEIGTFGPNGFFTIDGRSSQLVDPNNGKDIRVCVRPPSDLKRNYVDFTREDKVAACQDSSPAVQRACDVDPDHVRNPGYSGIVLRTPKKIFPKGDPESTYCYIVNQEDYVTRNNGDLSVFLEFGLIPSRDILVQAYADLDFDGFTSGVDSPLDGWSVLVRDSSLNGLQEIGTIGSSGYFTINGRDGQLVDPNSGEDIRVCVRPPSNVDAAGDYIDFSRSDKVSACSDSSPAVQLACHVDSGYIRNPGYDNIVLRTSTRSRIFPKGDPENSYCYIVKFEDSPFSTGDYVQRPRNLRANLQFAFVPLRQVRIRVTGNPSKDRTITATQGGKTEVVMTGKNGFQFFTDITGNTCTFSCGVFDLFEPLKICIDGETTDGTTTGEGSSLISIDGGCYDVQPFSDYFFAFPGYARADLRFTNDDILE